MPTLQCFFHNENVHVDNPTLSYVIARHGSATHESFSTPASFSATLIDAKYSFAASFEFNTNNSRVTFARVRNCDIITKADAAAIMKSLMREGASEKERPTDGEKPLQQSINEN